MTGDTADTTRTPFRTRVSRKTGKPDDFKSDGYSDPAIEAFRILDGNQKNLSDRHGVFVQ
jgi:hypothetical protein